VTKLNRLAALLVNDGVALLALWRSRVRTLPSAKRLDTPTLNDHIPSLLAEVALGLRSSDESPVQAGVESSPPAHGLQRLEAGFDIEEVVAEYSILRACIHEMAEERDIEMSGGPVRILNRVLDDAIGMAVKSFTEYQALEVQRRRNEHLAFIAHDLRTPLGAFTLATHILELRLAGANPDPDAMKMMRTLRRNTEQLDALVNGVLKENTQLMTELGVKIERRAFDLWPLVETIVLDLALLAGRGNTRLVNEVPDELSVRADAGLMRRVFQNLITNAITYAPGGTVRIGARAEGPDAPVECWVMDDGKGIPASRIDRIFDALETDPERDGSGLGLAIVKTFVEAHGGEVSVSSVESHGATFRFTVPSSSTPSPAAVPVIAEPPPPPARPCPAPQ
jgi:two-component system, OmpR family, phosphate regulon sensor histidine kinase PhoR